MIRPAFDEGRAGDELPARGAFGDRELHRHTEGDGPHEREPVFGARDGGRDHVADADASRG